MRVAGENELVEAEVAVLDDALSYVFVAPDECRGGAFADEADSCPEVWRDLEVVGAPAVEGCHPGLPYGLHPGVAIL